MQKDKKKETDHTTHPFWKYIIGFAAGVTSAMIVVDFLYKYSYQPMHVHRDKILEHVKGREELWKAIAMLYDEERNSSNVFTENTDKSWIEEKKLNQQKTELENSAKQLDWEKNNYANVKLDCDIYRYTSSVDSNFKCKVRKTIKCGTNEIPSHSLQRITCEHDSIIVIPKGKSQIICEKQDFEGLIEPRIDALCDTIRSIKFDVTK